MVSQPLIRQLLFLNKDGKNMGSHAQITMYKEGHMGFSTRKVFVNYFSNEDGYWKNPTELIRFFQHKVGGIEEWIRVSNNFDVYELNADDCIELFERLTKALNFMFKNNLEFYYEEYFDDNKKSLYKEVGNLFYFDEDDYDCYSFCLLTVQHRFFAELCEKIVELRNNNEDFYITLEYV